MVGGMLFVALFACVESSKPAGDTEDSAGSAVADSGGDSGDTAYACPELGAGGASDESPPVIIGGGLAGLAAAIDLGAALLLESTAALGGRAAVAGSRRWRFVQTDIQANLGEESSADTTFADWERMTGGPGNPSTLTMLEESAAVKGRLEALGLTFDSPGRDFVTGRRELFRTLEDGPTIGARFAAALPEGVTVLLGVAAEGLVFDEKGVAGVDTTEGVVETRRVLIASGGFAGRADLIAEVTAWPIDSLVLVDHPEEGWAFDTARSLCLGTASHSAIGAMSGRIGGLADGTAGSFALEPPVIWVNAAGERFAPEGITGSVQSETMWAANHPAHVITTSEGVRAAAPEGAADRFVEALRCYDDLAALALAEGIALAGLEGTLAEVERYRNGETDPFGRDSALFPDLSGTPCVAEPGRVPQKTYGGLQVDTEGRALNAEGEVVPGLWVAGESAGMGSPGIGGQYGFDGSLTAVVWSGWRAAASMRAP